VSEQVSLGRHTSRSTGIVRCFAADYFCRALLSSFWTAGICCNYGEGLNSIPRWNYCNAKKSARRWISLSDLAHFHFERSVVLCVCLFWGDITGLLLTVPLCRNTKFYGLLSLDGFISTLR
jgi:hypothetical protein